MVAITRTWRYEICRNSAMRNAAAPSVGGDSSAPMPAADSIAPAVSAEYPARRRIGHATDPSITVVATPLPETVPSRKPATVTDRPGRRGGTAARRQRPVDEERARAAQLEHRAVDREQDDVGRGDVERHAEDALERHVERADQPIDAVAAVRENPQPDVVEHRPEPRVEQERRRPSPAGSSRRRGASLRAPGRSRRCPASGRWWTARPRGRRTWQKSASGQPNATSVSDDQQPVERGNAAPLFRVGARAGNSRNVRISASSRKLTR